MFEKFLVSDEQVSEFKKPLSSRSLMSTLFELFLKEISKSPKSIYLQYEIIDPNQRKVFVRIQPYPYVFSENFGSLIISFYEYKTAKQLENREISKELVDLPPIQVRKLGDYFEFRDRSIIEKNGIDYLNWNEIADISTKQKHVLKSLIDQIEQIKTREVLNGHIAKFETQDIPHLQEKQI